LNAEIRGAKQFCSPSKSNNPKRKIKMADTIDSKETPEGTSEEIRRTADSSEHPRRAAFLSNIRVGARIAMIVALPVPGMGCPAPRLSRAKTVWSCRPFTLAT